MAGEFESQPVNLNEVDPAVTASAVGGAAVQAAVEIDVWADDGGAVLPKAEEALL